MQPIYLSIYLVLRDSETELSHSLREMKGVISYDRYDFWFFSNFFLRAVESLERDDNLPRVERFRNGALAFSSRDEGRDFI